MRRTPFDMDHDTPLGEDEPVTELTLTTASTPQPSRAPATGPSGEYPLSTLCLRLDVDGVMLSWTLRGDDSDVASRLPRVLDYIKRLQAKLPPGRSSGQARPETPKPAAVPQPPLEEREDWCPIHNKPLVKQANERGSWWSHQVPGEGWCRGKRRKAGA